MTPTNASADGGIGMAQPRFNAFWIAHSIIEAEAYALVDELEEANEHLAEALASLPYGKLPMYPERDKIRLSADCPHGWAAHDREDDYGACYMDLACNWLRRRHWNVSRYMVCPGPGLVLS
jgi:hypothetical protein